MVLPDLILRVSPPTSWGARTDGPAPDARIARIARNAQIDPKARAARRGGLGVSEPEGRRNRRDPLGSGDAPATRGEGEARPPRTRPDSGDSADRRRSASGTSRRTDRSPGASQQHRRGAAGPGESRPREDSAQAKSRRLNPSHVHRNAAMEALAPEERPIAEQVLRGGIPAVRTALHLEREKALAEGRPVPNTDELIAMAESLLPRLKAAEWRDPRGGRRGGRRQHLPA